MECRSVGIGIVSGSIMSKIGLLDGFSSFLLIESQVYVLPTLEFNEEVWVVFCMVLVFVYPLMSIQNSMKGPPSMLYNFANLLYNSTKNDVYGNKNTTICWFVVVYLKNRLSILSGKSDNKFRGN